MQQRTDEWYKARLGKITGSMVYVLMGTPRKKDEIFTDTAKNYLYQLAAERNINETYLTTKFDEWLQRTNVETFAMRYGTETEELARANYEMNLPEGFSVRECGFNEHPVLPNYGDSPDGLVYDGDTLVRVLEIKCPNPNTWVKYLDGFAHGKSLKEVEEKYYWQCVSHMVCAGVKFCDFVYYDKMMQDGMRCVPIELDTADADLLIERVQQADNFINEIKINQ